MLNTMAREILYWAREDLTLVGDEGEVILLFFQVFNIVGLLNESWMK
jgi:hypothetical protein